MVAPLHMVRSASLSGYAPLALSLGLDPNALLRAVGLPTQCLAHSEMPVAVDAVRDLLERSAALSGQEDFALRLAAQRSLANLGPISLVLKEEPTPRQALETLCRYLRLLNASLVTRLDMSHETVTICEEMRFPPGASARQAMELAVGVMFRILSELLGPDWRPLQVGFRHRPPADFGPYLRFFGPCVAFGQGFNGIVCPRAALDRPQAFQASGLARVARQYLDQALTAPPLQTHVTVRQLVAALLPGKRCTSQQVAQHLQMDRRTLHRHLGREGYAFSRLLDEVRMDLAARQVGETTLPLSEVAALLGFSTPSAFAYWFRGRMGCAPSTWRQRRASALVGMAGGS